MQPFIKFTGLAVPMDAADIDTDQLVPKQHLKLTSREGYGHYLFANWRYHPDGSPREDFVLAQKRYKGAQVLVAGPNFGSGSSREHAVWALADFGMRCVIAPSFAPIFLGNAMANGLLCVALDPELCRDLIARIKERPGYSVSVDLPAQTITGSDGFGAGFAIDPQQKRDLIEGRDAVARILEHEEAIAGYEREHSQPWQAAMPPAKEQQ